MSKSRHNSVHNIRSKALRILWLAPVLLLLWAGCSVERHYKILRFFFDGVPDPTLIAAGADAVAIAKQTGGVYYVHQPYAAEACNECHVGSAQFNLSKADSQTCVKCHAQVLEEHAQAHAPVVAVACLWCHAPHESTVKPLLRTTAPQICYQCHTPESMRRSRTPEHRDAQRSCLECHMGHGSRRSFFLRDDYPSLGGSGDT